MVNKLTIIEITENNLHKFNKLVNQKNTWAIVKFHADWCGHCKILNPKWETIVSEIKGNKKLQGLLVSISEKFINDVDIDSKIDGYPTIRVYHNGNYKFDYSGKREIFDLKKFIKKILSRKKKKTKKRKLRKKQGKKKRRKGGYIKKKKSY